MSVESAPDDENPSDELKSLLEVVPELSADPQSNGRWHEAGQFAQSGLTDIY